MNRKAGKYEEQGSEPDHAAIFAQKFTCGQAKVAGTLAHPGTKVTDAGVQQPRQALANCKVTSSPWLLIARGIAMHDTGTSDIEMLFTLFAGRRQFRRSGTGCRRTEIPWHVD